MWTDSLKGKFQKQLYGNGTNDLNLLLTFNNIQNLVDKTRVKEMALKSHKRNKTKISKTKVIVQCFKATQRRSRLTRMRNKRCGSAAL